MPSGKPAAACTADLQQLSFLVQYGFPRVVSLWLMEDSFRGHYPDGQPEPCDVSASDCRVMNCGDGEQAISMHRCFPPDRSIQGPPSLTQPGVALCHSSSTPEERNECLSFKTSLKGVVLPFRAECPLLFYHFNLCTFKLTWHARWNVLYNFREVISLVHQGKRECLERKGPSHKKFEGDWTTSCLSYLILTNHISSRWVEPVGYSVILPLGVMGDTWCLSLLCGEPRCAVVFNRARLRLKEIQIFGMYRTVAVMQGRI